MQLSSSGKFSTQAKLTNNSATPKSKLVYKINPHHQMKLDPLEM